ncbi:MFS transporter [Acinetobacter sp. B51(2017)]|uniref:MFS transporter n=1 Tax=Acinetobacter sp. B51(2017) TaxID=2060938 RepID=UPI000F0894BB|nr:MFS transporter [Acinetobacter sp. B51(2017)]
MSEVTPSKQVVLMMAITCALCAGCNYFNQPLIYSIAQDLNILPEQAGFTVVLSQIGYTLGLCLFVPLGDLFEKRAYICGLMVLTALSLMGLAASQQITTLYTFTLLAAFCSISTQILIPFAASLFNRQKSAEVLGWLMSGVLIGILFARTLSGLISTLWSWHMVYWLSGCCILLFSILMWFQLPQSKSNLPLQPLQIYQSLWHWVKTEPRLLRRSLIGALSFGMLSILFTTMSFILAEAPYYFNDFEIGLMGIIGVVGIWASQWTGKMIARAQESFLANWATRSLFIAWLPLAAAQQSLSLYIIGLIFAYFGISALHVLNQNLVYRISVSARSRINAIYMTCYFSGAALMSFLSLKLWQNYGWWACVLLGGVLGIFILLLNAYDLGRKNNLIQLSLNEIQSDHCPKN